MEKAEKTAKHKDSSRDARLQWSNQAEHKLRQELNAIALENCKEFTEKFVACSKANGLLVVFKCRQQNQLLNDCLMKFTNEDEFQKYKQKTEQRLIVE